MPNNTAKTLMSKFMVQKTVGMIINVNYTEVPDKVYVGRKFDFDLLAKPEAATTRYILNIVLKEAAQINLSKLIQYAPLEVAYIAKGAPCDLICKDADGDHCPMPSGVLRVLDLAEQGQFMPEIPGLDLSEQEQEVDPKELIDELLAKLKAA